MSRELEWKMQVRKQEEDRTWGRGGGAEGWGEVQCLGHREQEAGGGGSEPGALGSGLGGA